MNSLITTWTHHWPKKNKNKREMIPCRININKRPLGAGNKTRYKDFETDTAVSPKRMDSKDAVAVSTEIKSMSYHHMTSAMQSFQGKVNMLSSTADNGIENKGHADPHSPWRKPLVENTNSIILAIEQWLIYYGCRHYLNGDSLNFLRNLFCLTSTNSLKVFLRLRQCSLKLALATASDRESRHFRAISSAG